ncbi:unnamed protein product [[Candida] boidinii]|uniref:Unnamed protein product n=1 Tax=Candida boidinii TaxID=5477 RepID=A0A9W6WDC6_CANBO|nr:hypothetical protein B5S30_g2018 [[Candida] boidinii]GME66916.1 unnamed protein product [[Candida] boidinii]GMF58053.1 unnamed protein product [[Candida] boidinii]
MSSGTIYLLDGSPRSDIIRDLVNYFNIDIDLRSSKVAPEFAALFPLKKSPALVTPYDVKIHQLLAILPYLYKICPKCEKLLGSTEEEKALVTMFMSFFNSDFGETAIGVVLPCSGRGIFYGPSVAALRDKFDAQGQYLNDILQHSRYLTNNYEPNLADFFGVRVFKFSRYYLFDKDFAERYPHVAKWVDDVANNYQFTKAIRGLKPFSESFVIEKPNGLKPL